MVVWGLVDLLEKYGIYGMYVVVDFDICFVDGVCLEDCFVDVFMWVDMLGYLEFDIKVELIYED